MRGSRLASVRGTRCGGLDMTPLDESLDRIERGYGAARVVLAQGERPSQDTQLAEFGPRPLDAAARRKAPIRELRDVPLQTDR